MSAPKLSDLVRLRERPGQLSSAAAVRFSPPVHSSTVPVTKPAPPGRRRGGRGPADDLPLVGRWQTAVMAGPIIDCHTHPLVHESQRVQPFDHSAGDYRARAE